mgnify:CR=1 FL=1
MGYEPPLNRTAEIDELCMEIAELVGARPHVNAGQDRRARAGRSRHQPDP